MKSIVELHGLTASQAVYNGMRGEVKNMEENTLTVVTPRITMDVKLKNTCCVFCIGAPRDFLIAVDYDGAREALAQAISQVDSSKFYVFYLTGMEGKQYFLKTNVGWISKVLNDLTVLNREPLLRFYVTNMMVSDPNTKMLLQDSMLSIMNPKLFRDVWPELALSIHSRIHDALGQNLKERNLEEELKYIDESSSVRVHCGGSVAQ